MSVALLCNILEDNVASPAGGSGPVDGHFGLVVVARVRGGVLLGGPGGAVEQLAVAHVAERADRRLRRVGNVESDDEEAAERQAGVVRREGQVDGAALADLGLTFKQDGYR